MRGERGWTACVTLPSPPPHLPAALGLCIAAISRRSTFSRPSTSFCCSRWASGGREGLPAVLCSSSSSTPAAGGNPAPHPGLLPVLSPTHAPQPGGATIYFGPLGDGSERLIQHFQVAFCLGRGGAAEPHGGSSGAGHGKRRPSTALSAIVCLSTPCSGRRRSPACRPAPSATTPPTGQWAGGSLWVRRGWGIYSRCRHSCCLSRPPRSLLFPSCPCAHRMLEVASPASEAALGVDFAAAYAASPLAK